MAVNAGEVSVAMMLDSAEFDAGLEAARASLAGFARELAGLTVPPETSGAGLLGAGLDLSAQFAAAGTGAGAAFGASLGAAVAASMTAAGAGASLSGAQLGQSFAAGVALGAPLAAAGAANTANAALAAARSGVSGASTIGRAFASGLAGGIRAGQSGVISAAVSVARAAAAAARSALAIHSPSKVTRELGENFDLGFVRGVDGGRPAIERSVRDAVYVEPPSGVAFGAGREIAAPARSAAQPIDYDRLADAMNQRQMVLTMNNRRVAQVQEKETARAQTLRNRRLALGYGK